MPFPQSSEAPIEVYGDEPLSFDVQAFSEGTTPLNLTGWTVTAKWRRSRDSESFESFTVTPTNLALGQVTLSLPSSVTGAMTGSGVWELRAQNGSDIKFLAQGTTAYQRAVTR